MNPQALPPYPRDPVSKLASWDYAIGNIERWHAKTALDRHYVAGKLQPTNYNNRLSAIMVATMWSHLVTVFADLPAPGPAYDGGQLFKACQKAQKTRYALFMVGITLLSMVCLPFIPFAIAAGNFTPIIILLALSLVWTIGTKVKYIIARRDFIRQLNPQQREFLHAAEQVREIRFHSRRQQQLNNINS